VNDRAGKGDEARDRQKASGLRFAFSPPYKEFIFEEAVIGGLGDA
jgi:hypothetical protein